VDGDAPSSKPLVDKKTFTTKKPAKKPDKPKASASKKPESSEKPTAHKASGRRWGKNSKTKLTKQERNRKAAIMRAKRR